MWFAAHVIMYFKYKDGHQDGYVVRENVFLVEAASADEASEKATRLGRAEEGDSGGSLTCNGRPATPTFAVIGRLVRVDGRYGRPVDADQWIHVIEQGTMPDFGTNLVY